MKSSIRIVLFICSLTTLASCETKVTTVHYDNGKTLVQKRVVLFDNVKTMFFYVTADGVCILKGKYYPQKHYPQYGYFTCRNPKTGDWALFDTDGNQVIPFECGNCGIFQFGCPTGVFNVVARGSRSGLALGLTDENGEELLTPTSEYNWIGNTPDCSRLDYSNARCALLRRKEKINGDTYYDVYSLDKRKIIHQYRNISGMSTRERKRAQELADTYCWIHDIKSGKMGCFDLYCGTEVLPTEFDEIRISDYFEVVINGSEGWWDGKYGCYGFDGSLLIPPKYGCIHYDSDTRMLSAYDEYDGNLYCTKYVPEYDKAVLMSTVVQPTKFSSNTYGLNRSDSGTDLSDGYRTGAVLTEEQYRNIYRSYEKQVEHNITVTLPVVSSSFAATTSIKSSIKEEQEQMRSIRQEALQNGIYIDISRWETASY